MTILGPIRFETLEGLESGRATYTKHPALRPYQIAFRGVWHVQNRCEDGVWVYRATSQAPGSLQTDAAVKED